MSIQILHGLGLLNKENCQLVHMLNSKRARGMQAT